ncbi:diguanylate cyclase [Lacibacterium aquatile]|uniref:diguanylate cyclase n=1 Tax=Lacibacterium aquatile TaxID=1168082 RepID=A0ABW5DVF6_9PROT
MSRILNSPVTVGLIIFCAAIFGILTRFDDSLAVLWPANALLIGLMARNPRWASAAGWIMAAAGYVLADILTGSELMTSLMLTAANLLGAAFALGLLTRFDTDARCLAQPAAVLLVLGVSLAAGLGAGIGGGIATGLLFGSPMVKSGLFWMLAEIGNFLVILPLVLTAPSPLQLILDRRRRTWSLPPLKCFIPVATLMGSCLLSAWLDGAGALAVPVPALLWCAISYGLFTTSALTLSFSVWTMIAMSLGYIDTGAAPSFDNGTAGLSARLGVLFITLAPLTVASVMAARTELLERLKHLAAHDQLTGLLNRGAFRDRAISELANLVMSGGPSAVLMLDIDRFKSINDTYGHAAGDQALTGFAQRASGCLRAGDAIGRLGGEEFCVMLPGCSQLEAHATAERIRAAIARTPIALNAKQSITVTVSVGLAYTATSQENFDDLLLRADEALYRAKQAGRNRIEAASA